MRAWKMESFKGHILINSEKHDWSGLCNKMYTGDPEGLQPPLCYVIRKLIIYTSTLFIITLMMEERFSDLEPSL